MSRRTVLVAATGALIGLGCVIAPGWGADTLKDPAPTTLLIPDTAEEAPPLEEVIPEPVELLDVPLAVQEVVAVEEVHYTDEAPEYVPPVVNPPVEQAPEITLDCPEHTVPGWLGENGNPTSCVDNHPNPSEREKE